MAEFPALNFYTDAFLADTSHLGALETGAYVALLIASWRIEDGGLPDDDRMLARMARCTTREWKRIRPVVMSFWTMCDDDKWRQKRLEMERISARDKSQSASRAAKIMWLNRNKKHQANAERTLSVEACETDATTSTTTTTSIKNAAVVGARARVEAEIREAWPNFSNTMAAMRIYSSMPMVDGWIADGADLDADILPTVRQLSATLAARGQPPPNNLRYYAQAVADHLASRKQGLPNGHAKPPAKQQPEHRDGWAALASSFIRKAEGE